MTTPSEFLSECSECGHKHWNGPMKQYDACPLLAEGCQCPNAKGDALAEVLQLREELDRTDVFWMLVRGYPQATYLPDAGIHTIWWDVEMNEFIWGHHLEYHDPTPDTVINRLKELIHV